MSKEAMTAQCQNLRGGIIPKYQGLRLGLNDPNSIWNILLARACTDGNGCSSTRPHQDFVCVPISHSCYNPLCTCAPLTNPFCSSHQARYSSESLNVTRSKSSTIHVYGVNTLRKPNNTLINIQKLWILSQKHTSTFEHANTCARDGKWQHSE